MEDEPRLSAGADMSEGDVPEGDEPENHEPENDEPENDEAVDTAPPTPQVAAPDSHEGTSHEKRLRELAGRTAPYNGPIIAITRGWVSRDTRKHAFAARFLDFAVVMDEHLMLCSTGFFSRRPRRRVFHEPLKQLGVVPRGPEPYRTLRIVGDFNSPLLLELRSDPNSLAFARELLDRTRVGHHFPTSTSLRVLGEPTEDP